MLNTEPVRLPKKSEVVARAIVASIVEQGLDAGTPLPNEPEMLAQFGVARSTLREALRLLETQGVLSLQAGRSPLVRHPTADGLVNSLTLLLQFHDATFKSLLDARVLFEPAIAAAAARHATKVDIDALRENTEMAKAEDHSVRERMNVEMDFHHLIANASKNPLASVLVATVSATLIHELEGIQVEHDFAREIQFHIDILDAIENRDDARAESKMRVHMQDLVSTVEVAYPALLRRPVRWM